MIRSKSLIFSSNSSRVGKAISDSSLIGVPSCFSGGRRMVKWMRSTAASDLRRLRQVRSPGWGSPETSSTLSAWRMPSTMTTAALLTGDSSPGTAGVSISKMFSPAWAISTSTVRVSPGLARRLSTVSPSRRMVTGTGWRGGAAPSSSRRMVRVWRDLTRPNFGAETTVTRRSNSAVSPVMRAWTGAAKPRLAALAGTSCTWPSVTRTRPETRSGGTSDSARPAAANSSVPPLPLPS